MEVVEVVAGRDPLSFRDRRLVLGLVGAVIDADGAAPERELADMFADRSWSTVGRVLRELVSYGVLRVVERPRAFVVTPLGRAWVDRVVAPWPWPGTEPENEDQPPED